MLHLPPTYSAKFIHNEHFHPHNSTFFSKNLSLREVTSSVGVGVEIRERLERVYEYEGHSLGTNLGTVNAFVNTMKSGDLVLVADGEWVHIGVVGEYEYQEEFEEEGMCHTRCCAWKNTVRRSELNAEVQELLRHRTSVTKFKHPYQIADIDRFLSDSTYESECTAQKLFHVNASGINNGKHAELAEKALAVLESYLDDEGRKMAAAIKILEFIKRRD